MGPESSHDFQVDSMYRMENGRQCFQTDLLKGNTVVSEVLIWPGGS